MKTRLLSASALILAACGGGLDSASTVDVGAGAQVASALTLPPQAAVPGFVRPSIPVCPGPIALGDARCHSRVVTDPDGNPAATAAPAGYGPAQLQSAYALAAASAANGGSQTIAIVDAYDDPRAESDLGVYRAQYGLPPCTTANGCFRKVNQNGVQGSYPRGNQGWALEISLDLQMASAICPRCKLLLVEASSNSFANLAKAVDTAASLGANVISNSYGGGEYPSELTDESHFNHPGVAVTVSSGDGGYGVEFPASSRYVTAVGGTTLTPSGSTWVETAWSGSGSGCSAYIPKPAWQSTSAFSLCSMRLVADVAAVADPSTGVAVYDSYGYQGRKGWFVVGGTSAAAPLIGAVYALAGNTGGLSDGSYPYSHTSGLDDVTSGSNGSCGGTYLCTASPGYDGPTGLGTPNGITAF